MERRLTLVKGRSTRKSEAEPLADVPEHVREARAVVEAWLDHPANTVAEALEDLVARVADALAAHADPDPGVRLPG